jgi:hypothetical protein
MGKVTLPAELQQWAETEVAAGRATDAECLISRVLTDHRCEVDVLHLSLLETEEEPDREGWIKDEDFLAEIEARIKNFENDPTGAVTWDELKAELFSQS